jgi:hypothetical protein
LATLARWLEFMITPKTLTFLHLKLLRSILVECAAEEQEYHDEDGDPENAGRETKGAG